MTGRDWDAQVDQLPAAYGVALRLHAEGHPDEVIATALGLPPESVPVLLRVARAKLAQVRFAEGGPGPVGDY